ncbi:RNA polymerase sigma-70 factor [Sphingobacterium sp. HJSM2_6]|uniref:RNA polymerase sigma-70 factor n=1 Tax=Sphingobacterium sp. HJSM2_6 TaxID=3366264 RepID=UPI003BC4D730
MSNWLDKTDQELLLLLKDSNEQAFAVLYKRYWKKMFAIATHKLKRMEEAEEIVQDIFFSLWTRRASMEITSGLNQYLAVSVKYRVLKSLQHQNKTANFINSLVNQSEVDHGTEDYLAFEELQQELAKYVQELPEKCKLVFHLSRDLGLSHREISDQLGIAEKTVEAHLTKAIKHLRTRLSQFIHLLL